MIKIGITGSIASGKTTASKFISNRKGPLFDADKVVRKLYSRVSFKKMIAKKLSISSGIRFKEKLKRKILKKNKSLKSLEKIIHPLVRKEMYQFVKKNKNKKLLFFEIPLLVENKLTKFFDFIIFIKSKNSLRLKRFKLKGGSNKLFYLLNKKQLKDNKKVRFCEHVVVNNKSLAILKMKLLNIMKLYE